MRGNGYRRAWQSVWLTDVREEYKRCLLEEEPGPITGPGFHNGAVFVTEHSMASLFGEPEVFCRKFIPLLKICHEDVVKVIFGEEEDPGHGCFCACV